MGASEQPTDAQVVAIVEGLLRDVLAPRWSLRTRSGRAEGSLAEWSLRAPSGEVVTYTVVVGGGAPAPRRGPPSASGAAGALVVGAFLSATVRQSLREREVSFADATGNLWLVADRPGLHVERAGAVKDPWPTDDTLRSLRGRAAGRSVRALVDHRPPYGVRELAARAGVPLGSLSRTLDLLDREGLVSRGARGDIRGIDWERTIGRWAQDYELTRSNRVGAYDHPDGPEAMTPRLLRPKRPYAVSGPRAVQRLLAEPLVGSMVLYVEDLDLAAERLGLRPADDGDVVLAEGYDPVVFDRPLDRDGVRIAAPAQLVADLLTAPGDDPGDVEALLAWMRADEAAWRS